MILIVFVCLLSVSVLGCSNNDSENTETNTEVEETESFDVCSLITKEEAESAIGMEVEEAVVTGQEAIGQKQCFYDGKELDVSTGFVQIGILRAVDMPENVVESGQTVNSIYNDLKDNDENKEAVDGLGDDGFWGTGGLYVLSEDVYFNISVGNSDVPENMVICKELAEIVLSRL